MGFPWGRGRVDPTNSAELKGPETFKDPAAIRRCGTQTGPQTGRNQAKNARGGARKPAQTGSNRFRTGSRVFPRSKTFKLRNSSDEINRAWKTKLVNGLGGCPRPDSNMEILKIGRAGRRADFEAFLIGIRPKSGPEA